MAFSPCPPLEAHGMLHSHRKYQPPSPQFPLPVVPVGDQLVLGVHGSVARVRVRGVSA